jgi:hypothetical protein
MHPLHFGTLSRIPFKILWFLLCLSLALLAVTAPFSCTGTGTYTNAGTSRLEIENDASGTILRQYRNTAFCSLRNLWREVREQKAVLQDHLVSL